MNQLEEKLQRMISLYKEDNCQKVPENIAELMELASEFSGMLKSSGVRSAFFVEMLMHGGLMATMRRVMEDLNRPGFPGECFICELRLPDHCFRWKHNKLFLLLPEEY
ncbi:hypothetical protein OYC50_06495, partial [Escherichia coli]|nr:hypothetical protein [Escherichia coli]